MSDGAAAPRIERVGAAFRAGPWTGPPPSGGWRDAFAIYAGDKPDIPPLLGRYKLTGDWVMFMPRFPPALAVRLHAVFRPPDAEAVTAWFGGVPAPERAPTTRVLRVTPSASVWPENVLRFYVTFSAPMRIGVAWNHISMLDAAGAPMGGMFVEIDQELWDPEGRRLTVLFDPARIKRGLVDNINEGPPLAVGQPVTLEVDALWRDASGGLLAAPYTKQIKVGPPLREPLDPLQWRIIPPKDPDEPLMIDFPQPIDAALALRAFSVSGDEAPIPCAAELANHETRLLLRSNAPWNHGHYAVLVDPVLEDIAGNRIDRPFDVDVRKSPRPVESKSARITFDF